MGWLQIVLISQCKRKRIKSNPINKINVLVGRRSHPSMGCIAFAITHMHHPLVCASTNTMQMFHHTYIFHTGVQRLYNSIDAAPHFTTCLGSCRTQCSLFAIRKPSVFIPIRMARVWQMSSVSSVLPFHRWTDVSMDHQTYAGYDIRV